MERLDRVQEITTLIFKFQSVAKCSSVINDLSFNELSVLKTVAFYDGEHREAGIKMSEISEKLVLNKSSVSQLVNRLEDRGLVERASLRDDRRVVRVHMTQEGREIFERECSNMTEFFAYVLRRMGDADADEMLRLIRKFYDIVSAYTDAVTTGERKHA